DIDQTLQHARSLLVPGGVLLMYEATDHPRWLDVTTALIAGWQRFHDTWRTDHPLLTAERWTAALRANGFDAAQAFPGPESPASILGQHVLLAWAPGLLLTTETSRSDGYVADVQPSLSSRELVTAPLPVNGVSAVPTIR